MSEDAHRYTLAEIDALRRKVRDEIVWGGCHIQHHPDGTTARTSRSFRSGEVDQLVEDRVRTYMVAGLKEPDL